MLALRTLTRTLAALCFGVAAGAAQAQQYPTRPIQLIIPTSPGGGTDVMARLIADALATALKQPVVSINKPGASGIIASEAVARAPADGYTLLLAVNPHSVNPAVMRKLPYDTLNDFTSIGTLGRSPLVLMAANASGVLSLKALIDLGRRDPKAMSFASAETSTRVATERLALATGVPMTVISYKGTGAAMTDVAAGHVNFSVTTIASTLPFKGAGTVRYLAALASERSPLIADVPTIAEQGVPGLEVSGWWGLVGPAHLPAAIVQKLNEVVRSALADPQMKAKLATLSIEPWVSSPEAFDAFLRREIALNIAVAKKAGIEPE